jgi:hypothetical protein
MIVSDDSRKAEQLKVRHKYHAESVTCAHAERLMIKADQPKADQLKG